ncbi:MULTISPECIES: transglycosylase domain-containing protein [Staphylococcus]|jgi:penicillin-binding protein 1A|uniref:transglycosylase domain-containing protein n=1 Tax=Staphylococcus TaxID=1279 RepID=UPI000DFDD731|nr:MULTISPECIES: transglycosylase domain-containing protein [Staphylococcus]MBO1204966.1 penicillin-binding protein [Staphylococcus nepalensis]MBO1221354.1 penicillin-binding protein [Staphylococcus nepalensis]MCD8891283.1 penicillin-binding protein [Staphylococcus nepalensis]MDR5648120.1 transglycosylase domain-containing protein [Staphylococcus nepalensis]RIO44671.1 penicillin-binding protein [Staphylococcus nepalensis]
MTEKKRTTNSNKNSKSGEKKNRNIKRTIIKIIGFLIIAFIVLALIGILLFAYYAWKAPAFTESKLQDPIPAKIYDKDGDLIKTIDNGQRREHVDLDEVPKNMKAAVLATEDNRFYDHGALDYKRLFGAVAKNFTGGFGSEGASTLTQQVVKRSFLTDQKSIARKAQEAYLSYRLEQEYSKDEIFEMYLNKIYYSDGVYGVKAAAKYYFDKNLKDLNLAEQAYLAGLPQVPNTYNIYDHPEAAESRKDTVLYLMEYHNRISKKEKEEAQDTSIEDNLVNRSSEERKVSEDNSTEEYDSYINFVKSELMNNKEFKGKNLGEVLNSGVKIYTNMDKDVQQTLQDRVNNGSYYKNEDQQVGASIVDSESGGLVAVSGGRNYKDVVDRNLATDAHPTGSSLKPFLAYGPAIENMNWATNHAIQDEESYQVDGVTFRNYDMEGHGEVKLYDALRQSFNIPALKTWQSTKENAGNDAPKQFANNVGLDYEGEIGPSEVLGGSSSEFSPTQLASAFAAIANGGEYNNAHSIKKVEKENGEVINYDHTSKKAMKNSTSYMLAEVLKGTFEAYGSAYGHNISGVNVGAKTGTGTYGNQTYQEYGLPDDAAKDVWMNGFTPKYSMSVWMGFNEVKQGGVNSFVGHEEQEYPQFLFEDVMSTISPRDGQDFTKPDSVNGDSKDSLSVAGHSDDNTTSKKPQGQGGSSSSNSNSNSDSSSDSNRNSSSND